MFVAHPDLYEQAQYQGLATYQNQSVGNQGKSGKSSAEKDAEDAAEAAKTVAAATG